MISRLELQQGTTATHHLKSQGQAWSVGYNVARHHSHSQTEEHDQQATIAARHHSYSHSGEPRTGMINDYNYSKTPQLLTDWRAKDGMISRLELQ